MDRSEAAETLEAVVRARERTRRQLGSSWYARLVIGVFLAGAALVAALEVTEAAAWIYWVGGILAGSALIAAHYARAERDAGIESRPWDGSMTLLLAMVGALVVVSRLTDGADTALAVCLVAAVATGGFAWLGRDVTQAASAIAMAALGVVLALADPSEPGIWVNAGIGAILIAAALVARVREDTPARDHPASPVRA